MTEPVLAVRSPAPPIARVLHQIAVIALFADVVFFVVAVALGGVEGDFGFAAGALVGLVVFRDGLDGFGHKRSPVCRGQRGPRRARSGLRVAVHQH
jgi:hypothetical protein